MIEQNSLTYLLADSLPFSLKWLPPTACLVGGAVRDAFLNCSRNYLDLDFVLPDLAVETARSMANHYHAGFVILDEKRKIARVVFKQGTVDFAQQEGNSLEIDLKRRDFTINAIAYNFHEQKLIDPLHGLQDLKQGILRMVSPKNLKDDPLRLLRAYRQSTQLNFTIEYETRKTIRKLAPLIGQVAVERVQNELNYLLSNIRGSENLINAAKDGLFDPWFKQLTEEKFDQLIKIDQVVCLLKEKLNTNNFCKFLDYSLDNYKYYPPTIRQAKLSILASFVPDKADLELVNLKYPRVDICTVTKALNYLPVLQGNQGLMNLRELYFFFLKVGKIFPVLAILALAKRIDSQAIFSLINRYLDPKDKVVYPSPLVTGHDLIRHLNLKPSPKIGELLTKIQLACIEGKISTREEAFDLAKKN
ncbi:tRNA nucleotidyltransferase/poly(A) polymerase family protein [cyanobacterium endosymbiont of Epithemia turgida]|uniref:CCA tRNA nucleotidyltransferase n=1 Tax=cyanobacterium endosymbiont of Epithemia turgida TaxID=718217 RepID=UPI0004D0BF3C|nr:CCA tRNA nucleotidyltransferase [cyanobacterium endosymbiont of Epithemia turgida]BAP18371.1 poly(A) polymerase/tRNA nucleotidyltransferase family protein [cyanobacterium endosymbiont of Epithemia turgida isolate EtSB Lake Yunoko]